MKNDDLQNLAPSVPRIGHGGVLAPRVPEKFKTGDIVELVSGSPSMTVAQDTGDGRVECCYYNYGTHVFSASVLFHDMVKLVVVDQNKVDPEKTSAA